MNFKKWVKSIQTVGYNGAYTVTKVRVAINSWISTLVDACCLRHMWLCIYFMKKIRWDTGKALENSIRISQQILRSIAMWCLFLWIFMVIYRAMLIEKLTALAIRLDSKIRGKSCIGWKQTGAGSAI